LNSPPVTRVSLAAVGWRLAVPEEAEADVTPFAAGDAAGMMGAAAADREGRARGAGWARRFDFFGAASGAMTVTAGSWLASISIGRCACAGDVRAAMHDTVNGKNRPLKTLHTLMPPHDNCYNQRTTAPVQSNPAGTTTISSMTLQ
jgi:hypothetical protein